MLILRLRYVPSIDASGLQALRSLVEQAQRDGTTVVLSGVRQGPHQVMRRAGVIDDVGGENLCRDFEDALARARAILERAAPCDSTS